MSWPSTDYRRYVPGSDTRIIPTDAGGPPSAYRLWRLQAWKRLAIYASVTAFFAALGFVSGVEPLWTMSWGLGLGAVALTEMLSRIGPDVTERKRAID